jgi:hypothetical protein
MVPGIQIAVFWVVTMASLVSHDPEDEGSIFLQNTYIHLQDYLVSQPTRPV